MLMVYDSLRLRLLFQCWFWTLCFVSGSWERCDWYCSSPTSEPHRHVLWGWSAQTLEAVILSCNRHCLQRDVQTSEWGPSVELSCAFRLMGLTVQQLAAILMIKHSDMQTDYMRFCQWLAQAEAAADFETDSQWWAVVNYLVVNYVVKLP